MVDKPKRGRPKKGEIRPDKPPKQTNKAPKNTSIKKIQSQLRKNPLLSQSDIARQNGITPSAVNRLFKRHGLKVAELADYKEHRADLFAAKQDMVLRNITEPVAKRIIEKSPMAAVSLFGVLFDKERLERGQSTSNSHILVNAIFDAEEGER